MRAVTDITGFGFLGHALEMSDAAQVRFRIQFDDLPWLPGSPRLRRWTFAGGAFSNQAFYGQLVTIARDAFADWQQILLHDPQTSGGLPIAVPAANTEAFEHFCSERDQETWVIGEVVEDRIEIV